MAEGNHEPLPEFLKAYEDFSAHLEEHFEDLDSVHRGDSFVDFALKILPLTDTWQGYSAPEIEEKKTHDGGIDFRAASDDGKKTVRGQSKYKIKKVDDLDTILSKFQNYEASYAAPTSRMLFRELEEPSPPIHFVIVTSSKLATIVRKYEQAAFSSKQFYDRLVQEKRLDILDGPRLLAVLQDLYRRSFVVPPLVEIRFEVPPIRSGNVFISIIRGDTLRTLYGKHGSSLFFENIRDFLGVSAEQSGERESVNDEIMATLRTQPDRMLDRNNGITFKATKAEAVDEKTLRLNNCGIVNGCQTTMCVVKAGDMAETAQILAKVVVADDSWDVAKAANHQNTVARIDLDLARFLRPQLVRKIAMETGYALPQAEEITASSVLESIYRDKITYDEVRLLCLGLFSRHATNLFASNYSEVRIDIVHCVNEKDKDEYFLTVLFLLIKNMRQATEAAQRIFNDEEYASLFRRFYKPENAKYRCLFALLAACACVGDWLGEKSTDSNKEFQRLFSFLQRLESMLTKQPAGFERVFQITYEIMAETVLDVSKEGRDADILQKMYREISGADFKKLFRKVRMRMDLDPELKHLKASAAT